MKGIKMSDCRFYVNEEERTIVCVVPNTRDMVINFIREHFSFGDIDFYESINYWDNKWYRQLEMPSSFIGKAVCDKNDEWNEELGKKIAFSRAKDKCYKSFFKRANNFVQIVDRRLGDMIDMFNDFGMKLENKREALQHQIDEALQIEKE